MTITSFVVINSKDRTEDSRSSTDFTYSIGQSIEVSSCAIKSVSIPVLQYNVNSKNNTLRILLLGQATPFVVQLPEGQYDISTFMASLEEGIQSAISDTTFIITQDPLTNKLLLKSTANSFYISVNRVTSPLSLLLGFDYLTLQNELVVYQQQWIPPFIPRLGGLKNYYLISRVLSQGFNGLFSGGEQLSLLTNIPITVPYGFTQQYEPDILNVKTYNRPENIQWIDVSIVDQEQNVVNLNGGEIEIVMKVYTKDNAFVPSSNR